MHPKMFRIACNRNVKMETEVNYAISNSELNLSRNYTNAEKLIKWDKNLEISYLKLVT